MGDGTNREHNPRHLAHDLLQSVAIVRSVLGAIRVGDLPPDRLSEDLRVIETEVQVMSERLQRILQGPEPAAAFDVAEVAKKVAERIGPTYGGQIDTETESFHLFGDRFDWERALLNLAENACRSAGPDGKVLIGCHREADTGRVEVSDNGPGFGEGRVGRSSLGLAAVTRLVDGHGGHVELRRSSLGGAQLAIVVPAAEWPDHGA